MSRNEVEVRYIKRTRLTPDVTRHEFAKPQSARDIEQSSAAAGVYHSQSHTSTSTLYVVHEAHNMEPEPRTAQDDLYTLASMEGLLDSVQ